MAAAKKSNGKAARPAAAKKKTGMAAGRRTAGEAVTARKAAPAKKGMVGKKKPAQKKPAAKVKTKGSGMVVRYKCRLCGYIYSPLRGEPHNGIPRGTAFDDLPDDYVCPICGMEGKGKVGKWGFDEWIPTRYICSMCNYVYDEKRGEPHRGIKPGTKFQDLPDDYVCPVCALDPKISLQFGKVKKDGFSPLDF